MSTPVSSMMLVLVGSFFGSIGAVFLKSGAGQVNRNLLSFVNTRLAAGVGLFVVSSYFFVLGVREGELTVLYPLVSLGYVWTLLWSRVFFREPFTREKLFGLLFILAGIYLLAAGSR